MGYELHWTEEQLDEAADALDRMDTLIVDLLKLAREGTSKRRLNLLCERKKTNYGRCRILPNPPQDSTIPSP
ncbi:MAG: hypothetical protein SVS85_01530 [Candidatus Nanohaloarchaea archaeon]|nr:hypothetical protein [Candidatus Nanohaloarchaea archaeon]